MRCIWKSNAIIAVFLIAFCLVGILPRSASADVPTDPVELETFLDGFFASAMARYHVPGLVFVMVKDGKPFMVKGYGFADLKTRREVDPDKTLFRVASVSKLFTATAVMQLVEQGKLDLDEDVNTYLPNFRLPETFPEPITLLHLLTHTPGFDERVFGMGARRPENVRPLGDYLAERMPRRVLPPGDVFSYSNHGLALAGYIVESVSGVPFEDYIRQNILAPLRMTRSGFSIPAGLESDLAQGYFYGSHRYIPVKYDYMQNVAPAGSLVTTGGDIARFMLAHLQDGRLGDTRILSEQTAELMHSQQFTHHPILPGHAVGFSEDIINGRRLIGHGGNWRGFTSRLALDLEADLGFFVSYNALSFAGTENGLHFDLVDAFYNRYFPTAPVSIAESSPVSDVERFEGSYRYNRYIRNSFGKLAALMSEWKVVAGPDSKLTVYPASSPLEPFGLVQIEPLVFLRGDGKGHVVFREDANGKITHMFLHTFGPDAFDKLCSVESARFQLCALAVVFGLFLSALLGWPLARALRRPYPENTATARAARWLAAITMCLFFFSFAATAIELNSDPYDLMYGVPPQIILLLGIAHLTSCLSFVMLLFTVVAWRKGWWTVLARIHYTALSLGAAALVVFFIYWRLIGAGY